MSKRILSMFLVVVMLILAVPVFALPSFADGTEEEPGYESGFKTSSTLNKDSENWPTLVDKNPAIGNGTLGKWGVIPAGNPGLFGDGWNFGGIVNGKFVPFYDFESQYSTLTYADGSAWGLPVFTLNGGNFGANKNNTAGFSYRAPYTGTVNVAAAANMFEWAVGVVGFAIMVDNVIVYPAQTEGTTTYLYAQQVGTFKQTATLNVKAGQTIAFIYNNPASSPKDDNWANNFDASVTYTSIAAAGDATYAADAGLMQAKAYGTSGNRGKIASGEANVADAYVGYHAWQFGAIDPEDNTFAEFTAVGSHGWIGDAEVESGLWNGHGGMQSPSQALAATAANKAVALQYNAEFTGTVKLSVSLFDIISDSFQEAHLNGKGYYTVLLNGEIVWPANATAINDTENAYALTNADLQANNTAAADMTAAMADITLDVEAGDTIAFVLYRADYAGYQHVTYGPCVTYTEIVYPTPKQITFKDPVAGTTEIAFVAPTEEGTFFLSEVAPEAVEGSLGYYGIDTNGNIVAIEAYDNCVLDMNPMTFVALYPTASFAPEAYWPDFEKGAYFNGWGGLWSAGFYNGTAYKTFSTWDATHAIANNGDTWKDGGMYMVKYGSTTPNGIQGALVATNGKATGITWRALLDGEVTLTLDKLFAHTTDANKTAFGMKMVIAHNGQIIWPTALAGNAVDSANNAGWFEIHATSDTVTYEVDVLAKFNEALATDPMPAITVEAGDTVQVMFARANAEGEAMNSAICHATVNYTEIAEDAELWEGITTERAKYETAKNSITHVPTSDASGEVTYYDNWSYVDYPKTSNAPEDTRLLNRVVNTDDVANKLGDAFYGAAGTGLWDNTGAAVRIHGNDNWGKSGSISVDNNYAGALRYTAEYAGLINIDINSVTSLAGENAVAIAIFVDGNMVWPSATGSYTDVTTWYTLTDGSEKAGAIMAAEEAALLKNIFVNKGQTVDFAVTATGTAGLWAQRSTAFDVRITYSTLSTSRVEPVMSLNYYGAFAVQFTAPYNLASVIPEELLGDITLTVNGKDIEMNEGVGYITGIAAKNLIDEFDWSMDVVIGGKTVNIEHGTASVVTYLYNVLALYNDPYAIDTLNYAAAAQSYFGYKTETLANAGLTAEQKTLADNTAESVLEKGTLANASATIDGFTLLLQDSVIIKTFVQAENAEGYKLQVLGEVYDEETDETSFGLVHECALVACEGGDGYKAYFPVGITDYDTAYAFRIVDSYGNVVSATVTYSVASYAARMKDGAAAELLKALMAQAI